MKIKAKLITGIGVLFTMIVLLTVLSTLYINKLSGDSKNILEANYNTIDYSRQMLIALNKGIHSVTEQKNFEKYLLLQQQNITEIGETDLTEKLAIDFGSLKENFNDSAVLKTVRTDITDIMLLNMQAIQRKNNVAQRTATSARLWINLAGAICFLVAFVLLFNLPGNIANPIKQLTGSIKEIAAENYSQRIHFDKQNEFGELATAFNTMAQKLEEYKTGNLEKLLMEKKRIDTLINNMTDPVIGLNENKEIIFMNNVALKITGLKAENVIGKPVQDVAVRNDLMRSLIQDMFTYDAKTDNSKLIPVKIYADNKESYFEKEIIPIKIVPTGETEEKLIGNVILLQNITSYKELDFAKTNFIATVSHELKTPISSIKMSLQLLDNKAVGTMNDEQQTLVESIKEDANRLLKITGELLNMTQVESGTIQLSSMPCDAEEILSYAINTNKTQADQKNIKITTKIADNLPKVLTDNDKTAWVLTNIISNAIRYSYDNAEIKLSANTLADNKIVFKISDTGQGIPQQYIHRIFDRYFRIPGSKKEGTGLGLSISKEFIEALNGSIKVESDLGAGSTFSVILPTLSA